ncbi:MAG: alpha/beta hydrolase [Clostridia bacterium]|nr:alpha/beta hydrolase [Clostridia bacterium]
MWFLLILLILSAVILLISNNLVTTLLHVNRIFMEDCIQGEEEKGNISRTWYNSLSKQEVFVKSPYGYDLYVQLVKNPLETDKTVILVHGYSYNLVGSIKYSKIFYDLGYNVVLYDHGNCGRSGGDLTTMGYREKMDLKVVVQFVEEEWGSNVKIGLHGESMGASTALLYAADEPGIQFIIEDCGYSDLTKELSYQIWRKYKLPKYPFIPIASLICKLRGGFRFEEISPAAELEKSKMLQDVPILFIHGAEDHFTPTSMVEDLYTAKKGIKERYIVQGAGHAGSFSQDKDKYREVISAFLQKYGC